MINRSWSANSCFTPHQEKLFTRYKMTHLFEGDVKKNLLERTEAEKVFRPWWDTLEDYLLNILIVIGQSITQCNTWCTLSNIYYIHLLRWITNILTSGDFYWSKYRMYPTVLNFYPYMLYLLYQKIQSFKIFLCNRR